MFCFGIGPSVAIVRFLGGRETILQQTAVALKQVLLEKMTVLEFRVVVVVSVTPFAGC